MWDMKTARVEYSRTFNLDDFESVKIGISVELAPAPGEETLTDAELQDAFMMMKDGVKKEAMPILEYRNARRKASIKFVLKNLPNDLQETARKVLALAHDDQAEEVVA